MGAIESLSLSSSAVPDQPNPKENKLSKRIADLEREVAETRKLWQNEFAYLKKKQISDPFTENLISKANLHSSKGNYDRAIELYDQILDINPHLDHIWSNLGVALTNRKQDNQALVCFKKALEINPSSVPSLLCKGLIFVRRKQYNEALSCYEEALKINPRDYIGWHQKGNLHNERSEFDTALSCYEEAYTINSRYLPALVNQGVMNQKQSKWDVAHQVFLQVLKIDPENVDALKGIGICFSFMNAPKKAEKYFRRTLKINPEDPNLWFNKGRVLLEQLKTDSSSNHMHKALHAFESATHLNENYYEAWNGKGAVYMLMESYQKALNCFEKALEINPAYDLAQKNREFALEKIQSNSV